MTRASTYDRLRAVLVGLVLLAVALYLVTLVPGVRHDQRFHTTYDGWLQGTAYALMAVSAVVPVVLRPRHRDFWGAVAVAVVLRVVGFELFLGWVRTVRPQPYPSVSDGFWLASAVGLLVAAYVAGRRIAPSLTRLRVLDGLMAGFTAAAYASALLHPTLQRLRAAAESSRAEATDVAYPVVNVTLVVVVVALAITVRGVSSWATRMVALGVVGYAVGDSVHLHQQVAGSYAAGTWLSVLALLSTALVALAAWFAPTPGQVEQGLERARHADLETPIIFAVLCTFLFALDAYHELSSLTMLLTAAAMLTAIVRGARTMSTDRRETRRVIRVSEDERLKFQALVETSGDFIAIAGLDGRVAYVNPAGRRMVGLSPTADVTRTTIVDYLTDEGVRASLEVEQPAVVAHGHWEGESTLKHQQTGEAIPVAISSFLMKHPETGEPLALATVQRDITESRAQSRALTELAEQRAVLLDRLVRAEEAERARIAADVHDDSVQALAVVDLRLGLLRNQLGEEVSPEQVETLDVLRDSVARATSRLRRLLFDLEAPTEGVDLTTSLTDAAAHLFHDTSIAWQVTGDGGPELPPPSRLTAYRIAREAMLNTLKHAEAGRVVVRIDTDPEDGALVLTVTDDGRGFGEEERRDRPGHLGLSGMEDRATVAGGRLEVDSTPGRGTTVRLRLPLPEGPTEVAGETKSGGGGR